LPYSSSLQWTRIRTISTQDCQPGALAGKLSARVLSITLSFLCSSLHSSNHAISRVAQLNVLTESRNQQLHLGRDPGGVNCPPPTSVCNIRNSLQTFPVLVPCVARRGG